MAIDPAVAFDMRVPLGDGSFTNGHVDYTRHPQLLGIDSVDLTGKRILDIAANDGFWTFWAEQAGASDLLAIDIDDVDDHDWGYEGPPASVRPQMTPNPSNMRPEPGLGFWELHKHFQSSARRQATSVYELDPNKHAMFDLIFNFGLLQHLRHPLLSLDRTRSVCSGALILESHVVTSFRELPMSLFYADDVFGATSNWTGPTEAMVGAWLRSAGFDDVWVGRPPAGEGHGRGIFAASVSEEWSEQFEAAPALVRLDETYLRDSNRMLRSLIGD